MIRALIVDDEAPARAKLRKLLEAEEGIEVAGEAADGREAVERIEALDPDVVFLDIRMPRLDGFGVVEEIGPEEMPLVVFVTAFDEHAIRAFEVEALDYLLKPYAAGRLKKVVARVRERLQAPRAELLERLEKLLEANQAQEKFLRRVLVRKGDDRELFLPLQRVDVIRADRNYVRFRTSDGEYFRRGAIGEIESRLDPDRFLRINRSEIVRLDAIREVEPWFHGDCRVVLHDGTALMWSRRYRAKQKDAW